MQPSIFIPPSYPHAGQKVWYNRPERFRVIAAGTKAGKTYGACLRELTAAFEGRRDELYWWVAPIYPQARIAYRTMLGWLNRCKDEHGRKLEFRAKQSPPHELELPHGVRIEFRSAEKPNNLYGEGVKGAVLDEASRMRPEAWDAIRSTLSYTRGWAILIANAKGKKNFFYRLWKMGQSKERRDRAYFSCRQPTSSNPKMPVACTICDWEGRGKPLCPKCKNPTESEEESARRVMDPNAWAELYRAEFLDEAAGVFPGWSRCQIGTFEPPIPGCHYIIGADFGRKQDWSVWTVVRVDTHHVVKIVRQQDKWPEQVRGLAALSKEYNNALIWGDSTGIGDPVLGFLEEHPVEFHGFSYAGKGKEHLVTRLTHAISAQDYTFPTDAEQLATELDNFEQTVTPHGTIRYEAASGYHDDCVNSFGLAVLGCESWQDGEIVIRGGNR